jgi:hypothetical protein
MSDARVPLTAKVVPVESMRGDTDVDTEEILALCDEAAEFLRGFSWCGRIEERFVGLGVPGLVGVFLFRFEPRGSGVDPWVWVIAGDLPPAYITTENAPNPACALDAYIGAMQSWVRAVRDGRSVKDEIPVGAPPTLPFAAALESRLAILDREVLWRYRADLSEGNRKA